MTEAEAKFDRDANLHRTQLFDDDRECKSKFKGNSNLSAYRQAIDRQYLGIVGTGQYYAKPWGNDSSNIQAIINGPAYWKRVYNRPNVADDFRKQDLQAEERRRAERARENARNPMARSSSEPALVDMEKLNEPVADGYAKIKNSLKPLAERHGKPRIRAPEVGERLNFFNTLENKYHMKAGGNNLSWNVCTSAHRSSKSEANFILSNYFRTDTPAVLTGIGRQPIVFEDDEKLSQTR
eukprot:TRINITY_DN70950_c0_g1_i1.p1 TRINITY_DN70950_c0_g1~~TRINITY_DN70950_c0_g1_i1.p1  ORF type:complete len:238 (+),score=39.37 TRINITY_DN70950_c0_g1_i1:79-792(+)